MNNIKKEAFKDFNVLVIGDSCVDKFTYGNAFRLAPEAPVPGSTECDTKLSDAGLLHK